MVSTKSVASVELQETTRFVVFGKQGTSSGGRQTVKVSSRGVADNSAEASSTCRSMVSQDNNKDRVSA